MPITIDCVIKKNISRLYNIQRYRYPNCHAKLLICWSFQLQKRCRLTLHVILPDQSRIFLSLTNEIMSYFTTLVMIFWQFSFVLRCGSLMHSCQNLTFWLPELGTRKHWGRALSSTWIFGQSPFKTTTASNEYVNLCAVDTLCKTP